MVYTHEVTHAQPSHACHITYAADPRALSATPRHTTRKMMRSYLAALVYTLFHPRDTRARTSSSHVTRSRHPLFAHANRTRVPSSHATAHARSITRHPPSPSYTRAIITRHPRPYHLHHSIAHACHVHSRPSAHARYSFPPSENCHPPAIRTYHTDPLLARYTFLVSGFFETQQTLV